MFFVRTDAQQRMRSRMNSFVLDEKTFLLDELDQVFSFRSPHDGRFDSSPIFSIGFCDDEKNKSEENRGVRQSSSSSTNERLEPMSILSWQEKEEADRWLVALSFLSFSFSQLGVIHSLKLFLRYFFSSCCLRRRHVCPRESQRERKREKKRRNF